MMTVTTKERPPGLQFIEPHPDPNINVFLYGGPKTGKTMGAASAPGPILYLNADRPNATRLAHATYEGIREARVTGLQTLIDATREAESGDYRTVVLDTVGEAYRTVLEDLSGRAISPSIQHYGDSGTHVERFCRHLCELPVNAVFVAHELSVQDEESGRFERLPFVSTKSGSAVFGAKLMAMVDVIGYCGVRPGEGEEPDHYMAQLTSAGGRRGGDRFGALGTARDVNLTEWVELARRSTTPKGAK